MSYKKKAVIGVLYKGDEYLAEKRHDDEKYFPGSIQFPGGVVDDSDKNDIDAMKREMKEELGIDVTRFRPLYEFVYDDGVEGMVFLIDEYIGTPEALEAEELIWIKNESDLSQEVDRIILRKAKELKK